MMLAKMGGGGGEWGSEGLGSRPVSCWRWQAGRWPEAIFSLAAGPRWVGYPLFLPGRDTVSISREA